MPLEMALSRLPPRKNPSGKTLWGKTARAPEILSLQSRFHALHTPVRLSSLFLIDMSVADFWPRTDSDVTGEEDENVESELKGVKMYMKRGSKDFTDGFMGHIKLLSSKTSEDQRLRTFDANRAECK